MDHYKPHCYLCCPGQICYGDEDKHLRLWYPSELICSFRPFQRFQKVQKRIQKLFLKGKVIDESYFTFNSLSRIKSVRPGMKGIVSGSRKEKTILAKKTADTMPKSKLNTVKMTSSTLLPISTLLKPKRRLFNEKKRFNAVMGRSNKIRARNNNKYDKTYS